MCVFVFGVGTEAGKGGGEGSACSSPLPFLLRDQSAEGIQTGNEKGEIQIVRALSSSYRWETGSATTEPLPFLNLQWSGCLRLITGRALCKRKQGTHLHTPLHAGENSHILGERGRETEERRGHGSLPAGQRGQMARNTRLLGQTVAQEFIIFL